MHIHLVQYDIAWEDKTTNHARVDALIDAADPPPGGLIVLPELGDTGFSRNLDRIIDDRSRDWACDLAGRRRCWVLHGWAQWARDGRGLNVAGLAGPDGTLLGTTAKLHPFTFAKEHIAYDRGSSPRVFDDVAGAALCPLICYDLRFPEAFRHAALAGAELFTVTANWPMMRADHWRALSIARAIENQAIVASCNRVGSDPFLEYLGGSMIIDAKGTVIAQAGDEECLLSAEVDIESVRTWRKTFPALVDARREFLGDVEVERAAAAAPPQSRRSGEQENRR